MLDSVSLAEVRIILMMIRKINSVQLIPHSSPCIRLTPTQCRTLYTKSHHR